MTSLTQARGAIQVKSLKELRRALEVDFRLIAMIAGIIAVLDLFRRAFGRGSSSLLAICGISPIQTSVVGIMATGMVLVVITRNIDLSVARCWVSPEWAMAVLQVRFFPIGAPWNWAASLACGLALGAAIGAMQGWWIGYRGVPSFIVTLGGLLIFRGLAWSLTEGQTVAPLDEKFQLMGGGLSGSIGSFRSWVVGAIGVAVVLARTLMARPKPPAIRLRRAASVGRAFGGCGFRRSDPWLHRHHERLYPAADRPWPGHPDPCVDLDRHYLRNVRLDQIDQVWPLCFRDWRQSGRGATRGHQHPLGAHERLRSHGFASGPCRSSADRPLECRRELDRASCWS